MDVGGADHMCVRDWGLWWLSGPDRAVQSQNTNEFRGYEEPGVVMVFRSSEGFRSFEGFRGSEDFKEF